MIPLIVLLITFMVTIVILLPLRNSLTHIHITFQAPDISFRNPVTFIQTVTQTLLQIRGTLETATITTYTLSMQARDAIAESAIASSNYLWNSILIAEQTFIVTSIGVMQIFLLLGSYFVSGVYSLLSFIIQISIVGQINALHLFLSVIISAVQTLINTLFIIWNILINAALIAFQAIHIAGLFVFAKLLAVSGVVWTFLVTVFNAIATAVIHGITSFIHFVEIPFKILDAFWLQIKPYVVILGQHIQMSGNDFTNGLKSLEKVGTLLSSQK